MGVVVATVVDDIVVLATVEDREKGKGKKGSDAVEV